MRGNTWLRPMLYAIVGLAFGVLLVLFVWLLVYMHDALGRIDEVTSSMQETQRTNQTLLDYLTDCTDPDGECYKQGAAQRAEQVGLTNANTIAAAWCATRNPQTFAELRDCVVSVLDTGKDSK